MQRLYVEIDYCLSEIINASVEKEEIYEGEKEVTYEFLRRRARSRC